VRLGDREVVRQVYVAVRDVAWDTVSAAVSDLSIDAGPDSFLVTFRADHRSADVDFSWTGRVTGDTDGTITYEMDGAANAAFTRNRIGICLLHPERECAGEACTVEHNDGTVEDTQFPLEISPHQAFRNLRAITHRISGDLSAKVTLNGEIFETEDQRNWTDDSFKTYGTPMDLPRPVLLEAGSPVRQAAKIELVGPRPTASNTTVKSAPVRLFPVPGRGPAVGRPVPSIGIGVPTATGVSGLGDEAIRRLRPAHVRLEVFPLNPNWKSDLRAATELAQGLGAGLELALYLSADAAQEISAIKAATKGTSVTSITAFAAGAHETPNEYAAEVVPLLRDAWPGAKIGVGSAADYCQLNRGRTSVSGADFVAYSINPQIHAFDDSSIMDTLSAQATTVRSAKALYPQAGVHVAPVSLLPRFNGNVPPSPLGFGPAPGDPRQSELFTAAWAAGSYKYLAEAGAESITYFEAVGPAGLKPTETPDGSGVWPAYHPIRFIQNVTGHPGCATVPMDSSSPSSAGAFRISTEGAVHTAVFSLSEAPTIVSLEELGAELKLRELNTETMQDACADPERFWQQSEARTCEQGRLEIELGPYAVAFIQQRSG
jgi:hypothetical protein